MIGIHFLFPADPSQPDKPDEFFGDQLAALGSAGLTASLIADEVLSGRRRRLRGIPVAGRVVYRGWMVNAEQYGHLFDAVRQAGGTPLTSPGEYLAAHHLPNWYPLISELTPETRTYPPHADLERELRELGWGAFFVKDFVKSVKTSGGSLIHDPLEITRLVDDMKTYRGEVEGGFCVRRVEEFLPESERRYFVIAGNPFAPDGSDRIPDTVRTCAERIPSNFFSVDVVRRTDGVDRVVEVGDGQVSDLVGWSPEAFADIWRYGL